MGAPHTVSRTTSTEHGADRMTASAVLPRVNRARPVRPWVPTTTSSACRSCEIDDGLRRWSRLRNRLAIDPEADQRFLKPALSRTLQIVDRPNRNTRNAVYERKASSCRTGRTSKSECANVDDVKKLEL